MRKMIELEYSDSLFDPDSVIAIEHLEGTRWFDADGFFHDTGLSMIHLEGGAKIPAVGSPAQVEIDIRDLEIRPETALLQARSKGALDGAT
jgi:hypothetical protein